jgi:carboxylate-amine ligase
VPDVPDRVLVACCCAAARRGLGALVASPDRDRLAPAREVLGELVLAVTPALAAAGDDRVVRDLLADRLRRGSGAEQQRALWRSSPRDVVVQTLAALSAELQPGVW